jgi:hypothetical protein
VRTGATGEFGRVLDEKIGAFAWSSPPRAEESPAWRPGPRPVFLFGDLGTGLAAGPARPAQPSGVLPWTAAYAARVEALPRRARRLTPVQQQALECLRAFGCPGLEADFTVAELKSAFRALVLRYHPDRHPGSGEAERAQLSRAFAGICDAYHTLTQTN